MTGVPVFRASTTPRPIVTLRAAGVAACLAGGVRCARTSASKILPSFAFRCACVTAVVVFGAATTPRAILTPRAGRVVAVVAAEGVRGAATAPRAIFALRTGSVRTLRTRVLRTVVQVMAGGALLTLRIFRSGACNSDSALADLGASNAGHAGSLPHPVCACFTSFGDRSKALIASERGY